MKTAVKVSATPHLLGRRIDLTWQNPPASDFSGSPSLMGIRIVRRERSFPLRHDDGVTVYPASPTPTGYGPVISSFTDAGLAALTTYYYTVFTADALGTYYSDKDSRAAAFATENYAIAERLYRLLPAVHQRYDPLSAVELARFTPETIAALDSLPAGLRGRGPLYRFFHAAAAPFDLLRSLAEGLRDIHNTDRSRPEFLPLLAHWIGWDTDRSIAVSSQRNEIKFAPRLYRTVGTVPNLRAIVNRYTGWHTQVAEFAQNVALSNAPPQLNLFASTQDGASWRGVDDAAPTLGLGAGANEATGAGALPAILVGSLAEPFALRPGMELAITADDRVPVVVRFQPGDFANIAAATAAEVAAVLTSRLSEVSVTARGDGRIVIQSHLTGTSSSIRVEQYATSLVTLEGAPRGRISSLTEATGRQRIFYEVADPLESISLSQASQALRGEPFAQPLAPQSTPSAQSATSPCSSPTAPPPAPLPLASAPPPSTPPAPRRQIRFKVFRSGEWSQSCPAGVALNGGSPAAVTLADGRIWMSWIENPDEATSRLRFATGNVRAPQEAILSGQRSQPFNIRPGDRLLFRGKWGDPEGFEFGAGDFPDPTNVLAADMVARLNLRLTNVAATNLPNGTISFSTAAAGGDQFLEIDLKHSTAASSLGFDSSNSFASGAWGDEIDWSPPQNVTSAAPGRHADLHAVIDGAGIVRLFWAAHDGARWNIVSSRWNGIAWSTAQTLASGRLSNREPFAVKDVSGNIWLIWSRRRANTELEHQRDLWTLRSRVFDPIAGVWSREHAVTTRPAGGHPADREPSATLLPNNNIQIFFQSDRTGGKDIWSVTLDPATRIITSPSPVTSGPPADGWPQPLRVAANTLWLIYRSDRSVPLSRVGTRPLPEVDNRIGSTRKPVTSDPGPPVSARMSDTGTLRRFAGAQSVTLGDAARNGRRRRFDDLTVYTPQRPPTDAEDEAGTLDHIYTRGTVGLYLSQVIPDNPLSRQMVERLRPALRRFLPINVRAVVILAPRVDIEFVYGRGVDIQESYFDRHPFIERFAGPEEATAAALPDWVVILSNTLGHVSADVADLTTLRRRTYFPPPQ